MKKIVLIAFLFLSLSMISLAQEQLVGLNQNQLLQKKTTEKRIEAGAIYLPFFDNFKQEGFRPDPTRWEDQAAFVNTGFQKFPTDLGVATLDALDNNGSIYANANSFSFIADYLTSNPIHLDKLAGDSIALKVSDSLYLSFYYQPQGKGNAPEASDSLVLEFFSGRDKIWYRIWSQEGMPLDSFYKVNETYFKQVLIPIKDSAKFFHPDFKFRFYNYASLAGNEQTSWQSNADQWNIDYIKLDKSRTRNDIYTSDLVFVNPPPSFLKKYRNMPYNQYKNDPTNSMADSLHSIYISNLSALSFAAEYQYVISGQSSLQDSVYNGGAANIYPFIQDGYSQFPRFKDPRVISFFSSYPSDRKEFAITHKIAKLVAGEESQIGDVMVQKQIFDDYYAYDDGSSEAGYGMSNSGSSAALRYNLNMKDTLTAVQFYFNPTRLANQDYFYLTVWESIEPEVILYEKLVQVNQVQSETGFYNYELEDIVVVSNDFFVGFTQTTTNNLNVGFDLSWTSTENSLYYDAGSGWNPSIFQGALMIRPIFANSSISEEPIVNEVDEEVQIFPNPLISGNLNLAINNGQDYKLVIFNLLGKLVYETQFKNEINLDFLPEGVYLLRFENQLNGEVKSQKLIRRK